MADDNNREKVLAEYEALNELYEEATARDDDELRIKYGRKIADFFSINYAVLNLTEADVAEYKKRLAKYEKSYEKEKIAIKEAEKAKRAADEARDAYYDALLEQTPDGKKRTGH